jgi:uncharacterized membrane protein YccC
MNAGAWFEKPPVRQAAQAALAVGAAIAAGSAISGRRWYWAVIAAFIVALGANSRGEATVKGLQRIGGTLLGVGVGVGVATAVSGHEFMSFALVLISAFLAYYAFQAAYGAMVFFLTIMLSLLYGLLGQFKPELLLLRLEETAAGAAIGVAATFFILPIRQTQAFGQALDAYLGALEQTLTPDRQDEGAGAVDDLQAKTQQLRNAHGAFRRGWAGFAHSSYRETIHLAMRCTYLAREWRLADPPWDPQSRLLAERVARRIGAIRAGAPAPAEDPAPELDAPSATAQVLAALDRSVVRLAAASAALRRSK